MLRTQIYLPEDLRKEIDEHRSLSGDSMAEYTRKALEEKVKEDKNRKENLKKLAEKIRNMKPTRTKAEVNAWIKEISEDRRLADERLERRWAEARKSKNVSSR